MNVFYVVLMLFIVSISGAVMRYKADKADKNPENLASDEDAERKYAALCEPGETLKVVCRGWKEQYYVLTDRRLILEDKKGMQSIPLNSIQNVKFRKTDGGKARTVDTCQSIIIYANGQYSLFRYSNKFDQITRALMEEWQ